MNFALILLGFREAGVRGVVSELREEYAAAARGRLALGAWRPSISTAEVGRVGPWELLGLDAGPMPDQHPIAVQLVADAGGDARGGELGRFLGELELESRGSGEVVVVDADAVGRAVAEHSLVFRPVLERAAASMLILAWEWNRQHSDGGPSWRFLYHCRNAAAHNGRFRFKRDELARGRLDSPAAWGPFTLDVGFQDVPLFRGDDGSGLLGMGDPLRLLWDLERSTPALIPPVEPDASERAVDGL
jgi:hypothetical protein